MNCEVQDSADPLSARFCHPAAVAQDRFGNFIVTDCWGHRVRKLWRDGSSKGVSTIAGQGTRSPVGKSVDSDNPLEASFFTPLGLGIDGRGNIIVGGFFEHRVRIILSNGLRTLLAFVLSLLP